MKSSKREQAVDEQRRFPRVSTSCAVSYRAVEGDPAFEGLKEQNEGIMNNISGGGISFHSSEKIRQGQMLALEVALPGFPTNVISYGRVCWCTDLDEGYEIGVEFWWIGWNDEAAQNQIRSFITESLQDDDDGSDS